MNPHRRRGAATAALTCLLALAAPGTAEAQQRLDERLVVPDRVEGMSGEQLRELTADLGRIAAVVRANPAVASLPGPFPCAHVDSRVPARFFEADRAHVGVGIYDIGDAHRCPGGGGGSVDIQVNTLTPLVSAARGGHGDLRDEHGVMYRYRPPIGRLGGFPEYAWDGGGTRAVLLTRRAGPPVTPVSQERFLRALIRQWDGQVDSAEARQPGLGGPEYERWLREEKPAMEAARERDLKEMAPYLTPEQLAELRVSSRETLDRLERTVREMAARAPDLAAREGAGPGTAVEMARGIRDRVRGELAALSPARRAAPACIGSAEPSVSNLVDCSEGKTQIVNLDPDFFDPSLAESVIQVLVVTTAGSRHMMESQQRFDTKTRIFETLDYAALAEVLH